MQYPKLLSGLKWTVAKKTSHDDVDKVLIFEERIRAYFDDPEEAKLYERGVLQSISFVLRSVSWTHTVFRKGRLLT